jgi:hypothetical protein
MSVFQPARVGRGFDEMRVAEAIRHLALIGIAAVITGGGAFVVGAVRTVSDIQQLL